MGVMESGHANHSIVLVIVSIIGVKKSQYVLFQPPKSTIGSVGVDLKMAINGIVISIFQCVILVRPCLATI